MLTILIFAFLGLNRLSHGQNWTIDESVKRPWESYLQLGEIRRPLGLVLNGNLSSHYHFYVGYLALNSFMYDTAKEAFDLAINASVSTTPFIEAYIAKMLGCKQPLWSDPGFACGRAIVDYLSAASLLKTDFQREIISVVSRWFANESAIASGEINFLEGMRNLTVQYPNQTDFQVLLGLSLLNVAAQAEFQNITEPQKMIEARNVLKAAYAVEPNHPGALHYLIHAYDVISPSVAEQGRPYATAYTDLVKTSSHGQHMPAHIWMRIGDWRLAANSDRTAILVSYTLCAIKTRNQFMNTTSSIELSSIWNQVGQNVSFLRCDEENRAHSMEWLAYTALQTGDWTTCSILIRDLYLSYNMTSTVLHYLPFAYRTHARTIIELFYWFPYKSQFLNRTNQLSTLFSGNQTIMFFDANETRSSRLWSEAGLRLSECLRILSIGNMTTSQISLINDYINRLNQLANMTSKLSQYISNRIGIMPYQIRGIQAFVNSSWQECLDHLSTAVEREKQITPDTNSPTLGFARSTELLAIHLLLIYEKSLSSTKTTKATVSSTYTINNQTVSVNDFPSRALTLYQTANSTAPNRAVGLLGMAQAYTKMGNTAEATRLYNLLKSQLSLSNTTDNSFIQEIQNFFNQLPSVASANFRYQTLLTMTSMFCVLYFFFF